MASDRGHSIDIPITNLDDDDDDDFLTPSSEDEERLEPAALRDDFDLDPDTYARLFQKESIFSKIKSALSRVAPKGYSALPKTIATNGIELRDRFRDDNDSFDLSDDEFIVKRQSGTIIASILSKAKKFIISFFVIGLLVSVIVLAVLLSKKSKHKSSIEEKETFFNGTDLFYPTTILISLDGFHPHYISEEFTPALHNLLSQGYGAPYMIPSFPSSTFPNHWTIATGLYPQYHGIVGNSFFDPVLNKQFINVIPDKSLDPVFWGGESIWSTAEKQNVRSAIHMFPGSEVRFPSANQNPSEVDKYNGTETLEAKHERIFEWLNRDVTTRPELIIGYVPTIDSLGHKYGIKGKEIEEGLKYVDSFVHNLTVGLSERNLTDIVNLIVVSDHGMSPTSEERLVYLDDLLNTTKIEHIDGWPLFGLRPYEQYSVDEVFSELNDTYVEGSGYKIYQRENLPSEFNFGGVDNSSSYFNRIAPIWVIPDIGYSITTHDDMERKGNVYTPKGVHGYNNSEVLMRAIFVGDGPYFKSRSDSDAPYKVKPFQNVEVYNILCDTLNLTPAPNNGSSDIISANRILSNDWIDPLSYPNVDFDLGGIIKADSTYDKLFRSKQDRQTTTLKPTESDKVTSEAIQNTDTVKSDEDISEETDTAESAQQTGTEETVSEQTSEPLEETHASPSTEEAAKESGEKSGSKGFFESIEDELEDLAGDISEDIGDIVEDVEDAVEHAYHKFKGEDGKD